MKALLPVTQEILVIVLVPELFRPVLGYKAFRKYTILKTSGAALANERTIAACNLPNSAQLCV